MSTPISPLRSIVDLLTAGINRCLQLDPEFPAQLAVLEGKVIAIEVLGLGLTVIVTIEQQQIYLLMPPAEVDVTIHGAPLALLSALRSKDAAALLQAGELRISGDVELGQKVSIIMQRLDIDAEELLSKVVGDIPAHQLGQLFRDVQNWCRDSQQSLQASLGEYLQEEARQLPNQYEIDNFNHDVDVLREDVDRLQVRIDQLIQRLSAKANQE